MRQRLRDWAGNFALATRLVLAPAPLAVCISYFVYGYCLVANTPSDAWELAELAHAGALLWAGVAFLCWPVFSALGRARGDAAESLLLLGSAATLLAWSFDIGGFLVAYLD